MNKLEVQKYPAYKESKEVWAGLIPSDWDILPIRAIFEERNEKNEGPKTDFILSVTKDRGVIPYDEKGAVGNNKSEDIQRYKLVYPNDFVINKMNVVIGSLGVSKYFGAFSQVYLVYKPRTSQINLKYYSHIFSNPSFFKSLIKFCTGIMELRESLNKDDFKKIKLPFPDFKTQTAIANFLDHKTALIDQAIGIKEKQIELLKERRQMLIHRAVTRGLNPDVKMKDSGVEWIGEIPEGWEVSFLSYVSTLVTGSTPDRTRLSYWNGNIPWVKTGEVKYELITETEEYITDSGLKNSATRLAKPGTILMAMYGQGVTRGRVAILGVPAAYNQACCAINFGDKIFNYFGYYFFIAAYPNVRDAGNETSQMNLSSGYISKLKIPIPPFQEQKQIVSYLEIELKKIEILSSLKQQEIEKLKEYKASLINSAVTGKIKVC